MPEAFHDLVEFGVLASAKDPFDPMEKALHDLGRQHCRNSTHGPEWTLMQATACARICLPMSQVWRTQKGEQFIIAAKGAPEAIADYVPSEHGSSRLLTLAVNAMAAAVFACSVSPVPALGASMAGSRKRDLRSSF